MRRVIGVMLAACIVLGATAVRAESERRGSFDLRFSGYKPNIDAEFHGGAHPWQNAFGTDRGWMFRFDLGKNIWQEIGTLEVTVGAGYFEKYGYGLFSAAGTKSGDRTAFKTIPVSLALQYRFDWAAIHYNFPLVPYGRFALERYNWWTLDGAGHTPTVNGHDGSGATNGYSFTGGFAFLLDFLDTTLARDMDSDTGINDTYFFVDFTKSFISDFHSKSSFNLSDEKVTVSAGLLFAF